MPTVRVTEEITPASPSGSESGVHLQQLKAPLSSAAPVAAAARPVPLVVPPQQLQRPYASTGPFAPDLPGSASDVDDDPFADYVAPPSWAEDSPKSVEDGGDGDDDKLDDFAAYQLGNTSSFEDSYDMSRVPWLREGPQLNAAAGHTTTVLPPTRAPRPSVTQLRQPDGDSEDLDDDPFAHPQPHFPRGHYGVPILQPPPVPRPRRQSPQLALRPYVSAAVAEPPAMTPAPDMATPAPFASVPILGNVPSRVTAGAVSAPAASELGGPAGAVMDAAAAAPSGQQQLATITDTDKAVVTGLPSQPSRRFSSSSADSDPFADYVPPRPWLDDDELEAVRVAARGVGRDRGPPGPNALAATAGPDDDAEAEADVFGRMGHPASGFAEWSEREAQGSEEEAAETRLAGEAEEAGADVSAAAAASEGAAGGKAVLELGDGDTQEEATATAVTPEAEACRETSAPGVVTAAATPADGAAQAEGGDGGADEALAAAAATAAAAAGGDHTAIMGGNVGEVGAPAAAPVPDSGAVAAAAAVVIGAALEEGADGDAKEAIVEPEAVIEPEAAGGDRLPEPSAAAPDGEEQVPSTAPEGNWRGVTVGGTLPAAAPRSDADAAEPTGAEAGLGPPFVDLAVRDTARESEGGLEAEASRAGSDEGASGCSAESEGRGGNGGTKEREEGGGSRAEAPATGGNLNGADATNTSKEDAGELSGRGEGTDGAPGAGSCGQGLAGGVGLDGDERRSEQIGGGGDDEACAGNGVHDPSVGVESGEVNEVTLAPRAVSTWPDEDVALVQAAVLAALAVVDAIGAEARLVGPRGGAAAAGASSPGTALREPAPEPVAAVAEQGLPGQQEAAAAAGRLAEEGRVATVAEGRQDTAEELVAAAEWAGAAKAVAGAVAAEEDEPAARSGAVPASPAVAARTKATATSGVVCTAQGHGSDASKSAYAATASASAAHDWSAPDDAASCGGAVTEAAVTSPLAASISPHSRAATVTSSCGGAGKTAGAVPAAAPPEDTAAQEAAVSSPSGTRTAGAAAEAAGASPDGTGAAALRANEDAAARSAATDGCGTAAGRGPGRASCAASGAPEQMKRDNGDGDAGTHHSPRAAADAAERSTVSAGPRPQANLRAEPPAGGGGSRRASGSSHASHRPEPSSPALSGSACAAARVLRRASLTGVSPEANVAPELARPSTGSRRGTGSGDGGSGPGKASEGARVTAGVEAAATVVSTPPSSQLAGTVSSLGSGGTDLTAASTAAAASDIRRSKASISGSTCSSRLSRASSTAHLTPTPPVPPPHPGPSKGGAAARQGRRTPSLADGGQQQSHPGGAPVAAAQQPRGSSGCGAGCTSSGPSSRRQSAAAEPGAAPLDPRASAAAPAAAPATAAKSSRRPTATASASAASTASQQGSLPADAAPLARPGPQQRPSAGTRSHLPLVQQQQQQQQQQQGNVDWAQAGPHGSHTGSPGLAPTAFAAAGGAVVAAQAVYGGHARRRSCISGAHGGAGAATAAIEDETPFLACPHSWLKHLLTPSQFHPTGSQLGSVGHGSGTGAAAGGGTAARASSHTLKVLLSAATPVSGGHSPAACTQAPRGAASPSRRPNAEPQRHANGLPPRRPTGGLPGMPLLSDLARRYPVRAAAAGGPEVALVSGQLYVSERLWAAVAASGGTAIERTPGAAGAARRTASASSLLSAMPDSAPPSPCSRGMSSCDWGAPGGGAASGGGSIYLATRRAEKAQRAMLTAQRSQQEQLLLRHSGGGASDGVGAGKASSMGPGWGCGRQPTCDAVGGPRAEGLAGAPGAGARRHSTASGGGRYGSGGGIGMVAGGIGRDRHVTVERWLEAACSHQAAQERGVSRTRPGALAHGGASGHAAQGLWSPSVSAAGPLTQQRTGGSIGIKATPQHDSGDGGLGIQAAWAPAGAPVPPQAWTETAARPNAAAAQVAAPGGASAPLARAALVV